MKSKWLHLKEDAISRRLRGESLKSIHHALQIPLSTLSHWLCDIPLSESQKIQLQTNWKEGLVSAREKAAVWHTTEKAKRLKIAKELAHKTIHAPSLQDDGALELALAFLYLGEGDKGSKTSLASSDASIASFFVESIKHLYNVPVVKIRCNLHLRADQNDFEMKEYWSTALQIPIQNFTKSSFDKRTLGTVTYPEYKGVCQIECGRVDIQRRLMYIATGYSKEVVGRLAQLVRAYD